MANAWTKRLHLIAPDHQFAALNAFIKEHIDPVGDDWLRLTLSTTGEEPYTHGQFSAALTEAQFTELQSFAAALATTKDDTFTAVVDDNLGEWTDPSATLESLGLAGPPPPVFDE